MPIRIIPTAIISSHTFLIKKEGAGGEWYIIMYGAHKDQGPAWDQYTDADPRLQWPTGAAG